MAGVIRVLPNIGNSIFGKNRNDNHEIVQELKKISHQMEQNDLWFQMESNDDLIEACIYQKEVLNARYRYLLNKIREDSISEELNLNFRNTEDTIV